MPHTPTREYKIAQFINHMNTRLEGSGIKVSEKNLALVSQSYTFQFSLVAEVEMGLVSSAGINAEEGLMKEIEEIREVFFPDTTSTNWNNTRSTFWFSIGAK